MSLLDRPVLAPTGEAARSAKRALTLTATLGLVILAILLPVMQSSDETAQGYRIHALQQQKADLQAQIYKSQSQIAQLGALTRVDSEARGRLGMVPVTHQTEVAVSIPKPAIRPLPNGYLPEQPAPTSADNGSMWQKLLHFLPFS